MLANTIDIDVDYLNDGESQDQRAYKRYEESLNKSVYIGPDHELGSRDTITFLRTFPKQNGNFRGMTKATVKLTQDKSVDGVDASTSLTAPCIVELAVSYPLGMTAADQLAMRQRMLAIIDTDSVMTPFQKDLEI